MCTYTFVCSILVSIYTYNNGINIVYNFLSYRSSPFVIPGTVLLCFLLCMRMCLSLAHKRAKENCIKTNMLTWKVPWKLGYYSVPTRTYIYIYVATDAGRFVYAYFIQRLGVWGWTRECNFHNFPLLCVRCISYSRSDFPFRFKFFAFPHHVRWRYQPRSFLACFLFYETK